MKPRTLKINRNIELSGVPLIVLCVALFMTIFALFMAIHYQISVCCSVFFQKHGIEIMILLLIAFIVFFVKYAIKIKRDNGILTVRIRGF